MKFSSSHEWVLFTHDDIAKIGISNYAQKELGEIVYVELPTMGKTLKQGEIMAVLESTKAATDIHSPLSGTIVAINEVLKNNPELINESAEDKGWIIQLQVSNREEVELLMSDLEYKNGLKNHGEE